METSCVESKQGLTELSYKLILKTNTWADLAWVLLTITYVKVVIKFKIVSLSRRAKDH